MHTNFTLNLILAPYLILVCNLTLGSDLVLSQALFQDQILLSTKWVDYVEEPMKYQALRPQFFSVGGWGVMGPVVVGWLEVGRGGGCRVGGGVGWGGGGGRVVGWLVVWWVGVRVVGWVVVGWGW